MTGASINATNTVMLGLDVEANADEDITPIAKVNKINKSSD